MVCIALLWAFLLFPCVAPVACLPSTIEISPTAARVLLPWGLSSSASVGSSLALCPSLPATPAIGKPPLSPRPRPPLARLGALRPRTGKILARGVRRIGASWRIHPTRSGRQLPVPETWRNHPTTMPDGSSAASPHPRRDLVNPRNGGSIFIEPRSYLTGDRQICVLTAKACPRLSRELASFQRVQACTSLTTTVPKDCSSRSRVIFQKCSIQI
ncbi:uncharacterized protein [Triticum aestivum]|uniref:uncharacterized protein isoform X2 n=1 Tax=Triticum aestivum TaxID=4565 RepID=UPI001D024F8A|nr:uncharacterized protein LOC123052830 isoform X2 [Triticum aestivum]